MRSITKQNKSLFYISGLVLLLLLFSACILSLIKNNNFKSYGVLGINYYSRKQELTYGCTLEEFLATKKFIDIALTGNEEKDKKLLEFYQAKIKKLVTSKDSLTGVHIKFNAFTKYKDFVRAFEICNIEKAKIFVPFKDDLWITNYAREDFIKAHPMLMPKGTRHQSCK